MRLMGWTILILCISFFQVQAQKISFSEKRNSSLTYVKGNDFEGVVFSKDFVFPFQSNESGDKRFTPTIVEIEAAEQLLLKEIKTVNAVQKNQGGDCGPVIHDNLKQFARQYFGYYTPSGEKVVFISCLLKANYMSLSKEVPNWLKGAVYVLNGGSNYWQVQANLNRSTLFGLDVNGLDRSASR
ncbi:hypothetical protein WG906_13610 [Pedobacter sp. P351]|uniref:hypothetical protein n=1 Tax=Pedobacter superstes TaxID=3133441 RepID=UPI0030AB607C